MTEIIIMVVARNLRQRRKKAGLTQKADLYGCTVIDFLQPPQV